MVDDTLFDKDELSFEQYAMTPRPKDVVPTSVEREQRVRAFQQKLSDEPSVVIFTHDDADGLSSAALVEYFVNQGTMTADESRAFGTAVETVGYEGAFTLYDALHTLMESGHKPHVVYILDYNFGSDQAVLDYLTFHVDPEIKVRCYDHHQWDNVQEVRSIDGVELTVDEDECTATLLLDELLASEPPQRLNTLAEVTRDYDLWIREDPRSGRLQTFSKLAEPREYIEAVLEHGVEFPDDIEMRIDEQEVENEMLVDLGVERAKTIDVRGYDVAITYLGKGPSAEIGNVLVEDEEHDIAVVQKAHGGGGIYSHSNEEGFTRCHEIASELGGGGHPTASGFGHDFKDFSDLASYWAMTGWHKQYDVIDAVREVVAEDETSVGIEGGE